MINQVAQFSKVTLEQAYSLLPPEVCIGPDCNHIYTWENLPMPTRATLGSAGYDIHTPIDFTLYPGQSMLVPTLLKTTILPGWLLTVVPRSGHGMNGLEITNKIPVIDSDYTGHIMLAFTNASPHTAFHFDRYDRCCQGVFLPHGITTDDNPRDNIRGAGGFGSTGK